LSLYCKYSIKFSIILCTPRNLWLWCFLKYFTSLRRAWYSVDNDDDDDDDDDIVGDDDNDDDDDDDDDDVCLANVIGILYDNVSDVNDDDIV